MAGTSSLFGADFSNVRAQQAAGAAAGGATAYTSGTENYFGAGQASAGAASGKSLLAHELSHVAQQKQPANMAAINTAVGHYAK